MHLNNSICSYPRSLEEKHPNRRDFLGFSLAIATGGVAQTSCILPRSFAASESSTEKEPRYRIGVCDWMILKRQKLGAMQRTKEIGADGVEVDMGSLGNRETFENSLADPVIREQFLRTADELGLTICSLAMSGFYAQSFAERPTVLRMVEDCIQTMQKMRVKIAFLPLGVQGDLIQHPELRPAIVERLKSVAKLAEQAEVVVGVETALSAAEEVTLLDDIGSGAVRSYFNFANSLQAKRDVCEELKTLGRDRICQIHCTDEDGVLLEDNTRLDMPQVKNTLDELGWRGWLVLERSRDAQDPSNVLHNFGSNTTYLKSIFQGS